MPARPHPNWNGTLCFPAISFLREVQLTVNGVFNKNSYQGYIWSWNEVEKSLWSKREEYKQQEEEEMVFQSSKETAKLFHLLSSCF